MTMQPFLRGGTTLVLALSMASGTAAAAALAKSPSEYVDPFIGTGGEGHTYPGAAVPFGMVQLSPDTDVRKFKESFPWAAGYRYSDPTILGFSHTHFSGTGHSDMGDVRIMPTVGTLQLQPGTPEEPDSGYRSRFDHAHEGASPGYYWVILRDPGIKAELTATNRVGLHRYTFPESDSAHVILDLVDSIYNYEGKTLLSEVRVEGNTLVTGMRHTRGWAKNRVLYFALEFSKPFDSYGLVNDQMEEYKGHGPWASVLEGFPELISRKVKAYFNFKTRSGEQLLVKVALSSADRDGALKNLRAEVPGWDFNAVREAAREAWSRELGRMVVEGSERDKRIFHTAHYHTMLAPVTYMDVDGRYGGLDRSVHKAEGYTNYHVFSLWDTYRALHPLFTILQPERNGDMVRSMLEHSRQSVHGMLPIWSFGSNETWCMIGYHAVSVIADALLKGIKGFDPEAAWEAAKHTATYAPYGGLAHYMKLGFVPVDREQEAASKTLEYAYDDWAIARMAQKLGKTEDERQFMERAKSFRKIFDPATGFMRARKSDGAFREPFDPLYAQYGSDYTEGNAWQYSWYVPQDVEGLVELMGGRQRFVQKLDELFVLKADASKYAHVEDIAGLIGQYAHGNEPSQHIAYLYAYAGQPWRTQERIQQIMTTLFDDKPEGLSGNEDCGQMSAWYLFSALGFYPVAPGSLEYVIGKPHVPKAVLQVGGDKTLTIEAPRLSDRNLYIQSVRLNGQPHDKAFFRHDELVAGGTIVFEMGPKPNRSWATGPQSAPYSMSRGGAATASVR